MSAPLAILSIDIEARLARLEEGLDKAVKSNQQAAKRVDQAWAAAGSVASGVLAGLSAAVSVAFIGSWVKTNLAAVDSLNDISDATGATVENISALQDIARRTGTEVGAVDTALVKLNAALNSAKPDSDQARALEAIGLSATELRRLDPAEALREVAQALARFENDGNKARIVQELLGKSARELAPFLKDLGEAGKLTATVTSEQAEQAERLAKEMAKLNASATNWAQSMLLQVVPTVNTLIERFQRMGGIVGWANSKYLEGAAFQNGERLKTVVKELEGLQATDERQGLDAVLKKKRDALRAEADALLKEQARVSSALKGFADTVVPLPPRFDKYTPDVGTNPAGLFKGRLAALSGTGGSSPAGKSGVNELEAYIKKLEEATFRTADLSELTKVNLAAEAGAFKGQSEARIQYLRDLAAGVDKLNEKSEAMTVVIPDEEIQRVKAAFSLLDQTESAQIAKLADLEEALQSAFASGLIGPDQLAEGLAVLEKKFDDLTQPIEEVQQNLSKFAEQAQRNIQDAFGATLKSALRGNFDDIGDLWSNLLADMTAQALAARLNESLFGASGVGTTVVNGLLSFFGLADGGAFHKGLQFYAQGDVFNAPTMFGHAGGLGVLGEAGPEAVMPLTRGRGGKLGVMASGGASVTIIQNITINGGNRNELMLGMSVAKNAAVAEVSEILRRGGKV
jgi:hypothetical protein